MMGEAFRRPANKTALNRSAAQVNLNGAVGHFSLTAGWFLYLENKYNRGKYETSCEPRLNRFFMSKAYHASD